MTNELMAYHRQREQECRELAWSATNPEIRRRHEELAALHANAAANPSATHLYAAPQGAREAAA